VKKVIAFLLVFLGLIIAVVLAELSATLPAWVRAQRLWLFCAAAGGLGGALYCMRGVYLSACVRKKWEREWEPWYYIRPFASLVCGSVSCLFLKAGLLLLEAGQKGESSQLGFYAFAFVAGLNVDRFVAKIESIAESTWGIEKSRAARRESGNGG
jgi:hypothetical protein